MIPKKRGFTADQRERVRIGEKRIGPVNRVVHSSQRTSPARRDATICSRARQCPECGKIESPARRDGIIFSREITAWVDSIACAVPEGTRIHFLHSQGLPSLATDC